jgi:hypothetical protein
MVSESSFNPLPLLLHLVAIAAGIFLGLQAMEAIAPDLPGEDVPASVSSSSAPASVSGDDPDSLFRASNLGEALTQTSEQLGAGATLVSLRIEPGTITTSTGTGPGAFELDEVSAAIPEQLIAEIGEQRARVTAADIRHVELLAAEEDPQWWIQFASSTDVSPPWTYSAPLSGTPVTPGGAPPAPPE